MRRFRQLSIALRQTFSRADGWIAAALGACSVLLVSMTLPSLSLLRFIAREPAFSLALKLRSALEVLWNGRLFLSHDGRGSIFLLAVAFGIDAALIYRYMSQRARLGRQSGTGAFGVAVGLLGMGCASCGSVFLSSLLGTGATMTAIRVLPWHGQEFTWLGIVIVAASILNVSKKLVAPEACPIPAKR